MSTKPDLRGRPGSVIRRAAGSLWIRAAITLVLLGIVGSQLDWGQMERRLSEGRPLDFLVAVGIMVAALSIAAFRWHTLLNRASVPLPISRLARIYAVATFSNTFLPTNVGGDVTRTLLVARRGPLLPRVATTVVVDRIAGFTGLITIAWIAFLLRPSSVSHGAELFLIWVTASVVVGIVLLFVLATRGPRRLRRAVPTRLAGIARGARALLAEYAGDPALLVLIVVLSVLVQALTALQLVVLAHAIDVELAYTTAAVALALVTLLTMIPISIGGFGVREGSYVVLLGGVSIAASDATLISVMSVAALFVASLPGAYLIVRGRVGASAEATS